MKELSYPFDSGYILKKRKRLKRELIGNEKLKIKKKIAILGGSTTHDIADILELFLLDYGIKPSFYESEYGQYWQDAVFSPKELIDFKPDIIFIHTTFRNISKTPKVTDDKNFIDDMLNEQYQHFAAMWGSIAEKFECPIIQNNFERPPFRLLGNKDISDFHGVSNYVFKLNEKFYNYAESHENFYINDIDYLSGVFGLNNWYDLSVWYMYKYAISINAIPELSFNISNIIKSIYGKNKKSFVLDLDNTLWGGVVGDDGADNISLGPEMPMGQAYSDFQAYIKSHKDLGVILNVSSKNDYKNAIEGLNHNDGVLKPDDFISIKANWDNKDDNILDIADELSLGVDSFVFIDDNPAEREIVREQIDGIAVPEMTKTEKYIETIDRSGFFEVTNLSKDDANRNRMYKENTKRSKMQKKFSDYNDYLKSLEMVADIKGFEKQYINRIAQLTNKSNQFNLTTKRYNESEITSIASSEKYITLYGKLKDKFGDNGVVSIIIGEIKKDELNINLWLMSCRVLKRNMEQAMMDRIVEECIDANISRIFGYYYPTEKNGMVKDFYKKMGFEFKTSDVDMKTVWCYNSARHERKNDIIKINK